jgi:drug/metabolite transporter (DMT)-like permease
MGYVELDEGENQPQKYQHKEASRGSWIFLSVIACFCFAIAGFCLGLVSAGGYSAKFLNSYGYLFISLVALSYRVISNIAQNRKTRPHAIFPKCKDTVYYDDDKGKYKVKGMVMAFICGLLNFGGEFFIVVAFEHALYAKFNQGILTSIFALGALITVFGSMIFLKDPIRFMEGFGSIVVVVGVILLGISKNTGEVDEGATEGPLLALLFGMINLNS